MKKIALLCLTMLCALSVPLKASSSTFIDYQNYNHGYCPSCNCYPCSCGSNANAYPPEPACGNPPPCAPNGCPPPAPAAPTGPCDPCAPICGAECGVSICAIVVAIAAVAAAAAIIISSSNGSATTH